MDDIVYRPRYSRQLPSQIKRKTKRSKRDKDKYVRKLLTKTVCQALICCIVFLVIMAVVKLRTPQTIFLQDKLKAIMSYNIDLKGTLSNIQHAFNNLAEEEESTDTDFLKDESEGSEERVLDASTLTGDMNEEGFNKELEPVSAIYTEEGSLVESIEYEKDDFDQSEFKEKRDEATGNEKIFGNAGYSFLIPVGGIIGSFYGERVHPIKNAILFHKGIDIEAQSGTPIKAAYDGEVLEADKEESYGNYVKIKHIDGLTTIYAHCSKLLVSKGEEVKKGCVIAEVGATGAADGPHLHFEVRKDNTAVNPLDYIELSDN